VAKLQRVRERRRLGLALLEGPRVLEAAVAGGARVLEVYGLSDDRISESLARRGNAEWIPVVPAVLEMIAPTDHPRGPVGVLETPPSEVPEGDLLWLHVGDPGNAGTLVRAAAAFGLGVASAPNAADLWSPKTIRAGAGAHFATTIATDVRSLPEPHGTIATVVSGGIDSRRLAEVLDPDRPWAVLVGAEPAGLPEQVIRAADVQVTIRLGEAVESLNAGVAGSIVAYELAGWRTADEASASRD